MSTSKKLFNISVTSEPFYAAAQSDPENQKFLWLYKITIENNSDDIVQLLNRHWLITDMTGRMEEIQGVGVIGMQPIIKPQKHFEYVSFCQLLTPQGTMEGHYEMQNLDEEHFNIEIPKFALCAPLSLSLTPGLKARLH